MVVLRNRPGGFHHPEQARDSPVTRNGHPRRRPAYPLRRRAVDRVTVTRSMDSRRLLAPVTVIVFITMRGILWRWSR